MLPWRLKLTYAILPAAVNWLPAHPLSPTFLASFLKRISNKASPDGRAALLMGTGVWNNFTSASTLAYADSLTSAMALAMPAFFPPSGLAFRAFPRLYLSPVAQGSRKKPVHAAYQNNIMLQRFVDEVVPKLTGERGWDHLGRYNASVQADSPDGLHASLEVDLLTAMQVLNWLDALDW